MATLNTSYVQHVCSSLAVIHSCYGSKPSKPMPFKIPAGRYHVEPGAGTPINVFRTAPGPVKIAIMGCATHCIQAKVEDLPFLSDINAICRTQQICSLCPGCTVSTLMPPAFAKHLSCFQLLKSCCHQVNRPCRMKAEHTSLMAAQAAFRLPPRRFSVHALMSQPWPSVTGPASSLSSPCAA